MTHLDLQTLLSHNLPAAAKTVIQAADWVIVNTTGKHVSMAEIYTEETKNLLSSFGFVIVENHSDPIEGPWTDITWK